jgi:cis-3-alkyl-4-acyloxetan-2-one decarboxylase
VTGTRSFEAGLLPFRSGWRANGKYWQHYVDEGPRDAAKTIVMVHGNPTWSFYFRRLIREFATTHRVIAVDHMGCGLSDVPPDTDYDYSFERRVMDLDEVLSHAGVAGTFTLVVHDWGGLIGSAWAVEHPDRVERLIVLNTAAFPVIGRLPALLSIARLPVVAPFAILHFNAFAGLASVLGSGKTLSDEAKRGLLAPYDSPKHRLATLRFVQDIPLEVNDRGYALLKRTADGLVRLEHKPMLVCWGMKDFVFNASYLAEWQRRFPKAQVHRFEDAGHYVLEDEPEAIATLARRFVDEARLS